MDELTARILVVDDLPVNLVSMKEALEPLGHSVISASSGEEALRRLLAEEFAVVLLDVNMPGMGGLETARFLRSLERTRTLPIVFVTARDANEGDLKQALAFGMTDFVYKPVSSRTLRDKVSIYVDLHEKNRRLRHLAEQQRLRAEAERDRFQDTFDLAPLGIGYLTPEGRWLGVNPKLCEMLAYPNEELLARPLCELVSVDGREACAGALRRIVAGERSVTLEICLVCQDGWKRWVQLTGSAAREGAAPRYLIALFEDITERKQSELQRSHAQQEAEGQRRLLEEAKRQLEESAVLRERFVGIVSHDLRNPLGAAQMSARLLEDLELAANAKPLVARIQRACRTMQSLIEDLLDLTRVRQGGGIAIRRERVDLAVLCQRVAEEVRAARPDDRIDVETMAIDVDGDPERLAQALTNVVTNAVRYRRDGTPVQVSLRRNEQRASIEIHNEGEPIPRELLPHLFDAFRKGESAKRTRTAGLGLGLYIAQQVIVAHDGSIEVSSEAESGTTFSIELPISG